jgi:hypothetical protein
MCICVSVCVTFVWCNKNNNFLFPLSSHTYIHTHPQTPDGVFVLQEIYGIAGTTTTGSPSTTTTNTDGSTAQQEEDPSLSECVVCLTNKRELAILPCRHMCVCRTCAAECIRSQDSRCPICRNPAQALLKLTLDEDDRHADAQVHA